MERFLKISVIVMLVAGVAGFIDATYLTIEHYFGDVPPCSIVGCEIVLTSAQSEIAGVPVALLGSLYYLAILILLVVYLSGKKEFIIKFASGMTIIGIVASSYFVYLQFFVIKEICQYCMVSAGTSAILFIFGMYNLYKINSRELINN